MEEGIDFERKKVRLSLRSKKDVKPAASSSGQSNNYEHELQRNLVNIGDAQSKCAVTYASCTAQVNQKTSSVEKIVQQGVTFMNWTSLPEPEMQLKRDIMVPTPTQDCEWICLPKPCRHCFCRTVH